MKMTLELPDDLLRAVKIRAVNEGRRIKDVMAELISRGLAQPAPVADPLRTTVRLPLIRGAHPALPGQEATPHRIAKILEREDAHTSSDSR